MVLEGEAAKAAADMESLQQLASGLQDKIDTLTESVEGKARAAGLMEDQLRHLRQELALAQGKLEAQAHALSSSGNDALIAFRAESEEATRYLLDQHATEVSALRQQVRPRLFA